jgi:hypothetical protein
MGENVELYEVAIITGEKFQIVPILASSKEKAKMKVIYMHSTTITPDTEVFVRPFC